MRFATHRSFWALLASVAVGISFASATDSAAELPPTLPEIAPPQSYFVIPIHGTIGEECIARQFRFYLEDAIKLGPDVVVLDIDTPGGSVYETELIVTTIINQKHVRFVAFVKNALSAGVPIAMACKEIYVTKQARIGAALSFQLSGEGMPKEIGEKMQSAWRALCRSAAEHGQHSPLLAEAMTNPDFVLTMRQEQGRPILESNGKGRVLKARGKILTLTASESLECGLAKAEVDTYESLGARLDMARWVRKMSLYQKAHELMTAKAWPAMRSQNWRAAERVLRKLAKDNKENPYLWFYHGRACYGDKKYSAAIASLKRGLRLIPRSYYAHIWLGDSYLMQGREAEATKAFKKATTIRPTYAEAFIGMGVAYAKYKRYADAVSALQRAIQCDPRSIEAFDWLGLVYQASGRHEEAATTYKTLLSLRPDRATEIDIKSRLKQLPP